MFIENDFVWLIAQNGKDTISSPSLMMDRDLEVEYARREKAPVTTKVVIESLLPSVKFLFDGWNYGSGQDYNYCPYKSRDDNFYTDNRRRSYINYGCQPYSSVSPSVDQVSVVCLYYNCNATVDATVKTASQSGALIDERRFRLTKNQVTFPSYEPEVEDINPPEFSQSFSGSYEVTSQRLRRSFAVSRHPTDPYSYYVMTPNMVLSLVQFKGECYGIVQATIIDLVESMKSELTTGMVAINNYIWCLMPMNRGLAKISKEEGRVIKLYDLGFIIDDAEILLKQQLKNNIQLTDRGGPMTNFYQMSSIAFDSKRKLFHITGQMWGKRYVIRISDSDI